MPPSTPVLNPAEELARYRTKYGPLDDGPAQTEPTGTTHVLFVVDMSGSMSTLAADVRGGFNTYLSDLASKPGRYQLTVALFDTEYETLCADSALADVPRLDSGNYRPRGMTALLDAVGRTITAFEARVPRLGEHDRVLLVVQTDGQENSSHEYRWDRIAQMIRDREATGKWSCMYLGAHADAWGQASRMGFDRGSTIAVAHSSVGTRSTYSGLTEASAAFAAGASGADAAGIVSATPGTGES